MKRWFWTLAAALAVTAALTLGASAAEITDSGECGKEGGNLTWTLDEEGTLTISGTGEMADYDYDSATPWSKSDVKKVVIGEGVTSIGGNAFRGSSGLTSVTIPEGVTSIGDSAFFNCGGLASAGPIGGGYDYEFGWTESIPANAFNGCYDLTDVTIPEGVKGIGIVAFGDCGLTSVKIPDSVTSIESAAFRFCYDLTSVTIPESVTDMGESVFYRCGGLKSAGPIGGGYNIEFGWTEGIPTNAFNGCDGLTSAAIPESVTSIGDNAFRSCDSLTSVTIPANVTSVGHEVFLHCSKLREILVDSANSKFESIDGVLFNRDGTVLVQYPAGKQRTSYDIPEGVTRIEEGAFYSCGDLTSVTIPGSVTSIGDYAFVSCGGLKSVTIPDSVDSIGDGAFSGCSSITTIGPIEGEYDLRISGMKLKTISRGMFSGCEGLTSVVIPTGVSCIDEDAFRGCRSLVSAEVPEGVTTIRCGAFAACDVLTSVIIPASATDLGRTDMGMNSVFVGSPSLLSAGPIGGDYNIQFGWTERIPEMAFYACRSLTSITIPENITTIGYGAFMECLSLTNVTIPEHVTKLEYQVFDDCRNLVEVHFPKTLTNVGFSLFRGCENLRNIYYGGSEKRWRQIQERGFEGIEKPESAVIHYALDSYTVTYDPGGGTREKAPELFDEGETLTLPGSRTFTAPAGKDFKAWSVNGAEYAPGDTLTVTENLTVTAVWEAADVFTVSVSAGEHGTIEAAGTLEVFRGQTGILEVSRGRGRMLTILPDEGYRTSLTVDGVSVIKNGTLVEGTLPDVSEVIAANSRTDTDSVSYYAYPWEHVAGRFVRLYLVDVCADRTVSASFTPESGPEVPPPEETEKKLEDLAKDLTATGEEIRKALESMSGDIAEAVKELGGQVFDKIEALEKRLGEGGSATVEVEAGAGFLRTDVSVTGAKLNFDYSKTVTLKVGKPENPDLQVPESPAALTRFSMKLVEGKNNNAAELTVPIRVTLPAPVRNLKPQTLKVWHYHGGRLVPVTLTSRPFQKDGQWYVSFMVEGFSDFIMTYETEAEPVTAALSPDGKRVEFTDPAGLLAGGARVLAARYDGGRLAESVSSGIAAGESAADFTKALSADWRLFLLNPKTGAPLCGVDWKK